MPILIKPKHQKAFDAIDNDIDIFTDGSPLTVPNTRVFLLKYSTSPCFFDPPVGTMSIVLEGEHSPVTIHINSNFETYIPDPSEGE